MDYAGLGKRNRFPVNRPLTVEERSNRYRQQALSDVAPMDFLSVVKLNSRYIELVDRWYPIKGFWAWLSISIGIISFFAGTYLLYTAMVPRLSEWWAPLVGALLATVFFLIAWFGACYAFKVECLGWTHYPMRLNRKTRQVHVFRQDGTVLTVPWDDLFITLGTAKAPLTGTTYDLRAHVLDADGETVRESFSLGYTFPGKKDSIDKFWAFLQPYMEAPDGVERTYEHLKDGLLMPVDGRKEGWRWSIVRTFAPSWPYPWTALLLCIPLGLNAIGRMFAMWTSKVPEWPHEVEDACAIEADDPYVLTWRDNGRLGWWELYWPLICTVLGVGIFIGAIASIFLAW